MAFCTKCGAQISDGAAFCTSCGQAISSNGEKQMNKDNGVPTFTPPTPTFEPPKMRNRNLMVRPATIIRTSPL